ncbi:MAG: hypothetical protein KAI17_12750, partial [Thiotrichaceae bacterium]|nr:hypothetical protein [Thiotrichaceae bacterium]
IDDVDKTIARKKDFFHQQIKVFIINILIAATIFIIFMLIVHYILSKYFFKNKSTVEKITTTSQIKESPETMISINDSIKFAQEISKTILTEQSKLLAHVINIHKNDNTLQERDTIKHLSE